MGSLYKRGNVWWCKYYENGRPVRVSTETEKQKEAERILKQREGRVANGEPLLPRVDRIRYEEIAADLRRHYETSGERDLVEVDKRLKPLARFFTGRRVASIGPADATKYVEQRQRAEIANGTINRELAVLTKMLRFAYETGKLLRLPMIRKLREADPRAGFVERERFEAIARRLPEPHALAVRICYELAWRRGEVFGLERRHVDLARGTLSLDVGSTKTRDGRLAYLTPDLVTRLRAHFERLDALQRRLGRVIPRVFIHLDGRHVGQPIGDFRKVWVRTCKAVGAPGLLVHDLRRSGIRNMIRAGVSEHTAMKVSGHKTRSVFDRYDIVTESDLKEAARKLAASAPGTISGTIAPGAVSSVR